MTAKGCYLSVDLEDFSYNLQRDLGLADPKSRSFAVNLAVDRFLEILDGVPGSKEATFFSTGQVARDNKELIRRLSDSGHEIGCHNYYHDNVDSGNRLDFANALDSAINVISQSSGSQVYGFRAPNFSVDRNNIWAYEEISKRFLYDSSLIYDSSAKCGNGYDLIVFDGITLVEFPVFSSRLFPGINVKVIGGTYLKILPLKIILKLMQNAADSGFIPLIYIHPYELLHDREFWVGSDDMKGVSLKTKAYWKIRQNQWLTVGNRKLIKKLVEILKVFPNQGTMYSHLSR